jgi:hypothetical protein
LKASLTKDVFALYFSIIFGLSPKYQHILESKAQKLALQKKVIFIENYLKIKN